MLIRIWICLDRRGNYSELVSWWRIGIRTVPYSLDPCQLRAMVIVSPELTAVVLRAVSSVEGPRAPSRRTAGSSRPSAHRSCAGPAASATRAPRPGPRSPGRLQATTAGGRGRVFGWGVEPRGNPTDNGPLQPSRAPEGRHATTTDHSLKPGRHPRERSGLTVLLRRSRVGSVSELLTLAQPEIIVHLNHKRNQ